MLPQAVLPLLMNTLIAAMFVASFLTIAYLNPSARNTVWLAVSYGFGALEPVSHLAAVVGADPGVVKVFAPCTFLAGLAMMSPALSIFYRRPPMWRTCGALIGAGALYYWLVRDARTEWFWHELGYQSFFAGAMLLCSFTVLRHAPRSPMNLVLRGVFVVAGLHFMFKPFIAHHFGVDRVDSDYAASLYAVFSQTSSGVLLVAAGLLILITVLQSVVRTNHGEARTDPLTALPNRRALYEAFRALRARARTPVIATAIVDLDRFKQINDQLGHDGGDAVLRQVADCLEQTRPATATAARIGGEEFVLLLPGCDLEPARLICESIRLSIARLAVADLAGVTVSIGLTVAGAQEDLTDALRRADRALYQAKRAGRNRCIVAGAEEPVERPRLTVVQA